jgi:hypothetical protein
MLHGQFRAAGRETTMARDMVMNALILVTGIAVLIAVNYVPLLLGGTLWVDTQPLLAIVAGFQFVPILAIVAIMSTFFFRLTGTVYTGAFLGAIFVTWTLAAGTATQYPIQPWDAGGMFVRLGIPMLIGIGLLVWGVHSKGGAISVPEEDREEAEALRRLGV